MAAADLLSAHLVDSFVRDTGLAATDPGFLDAAATLSAQTGLALFVSISGILLILFLAPPHRVVAAWTAPSTDRRPLLLVVALLAGCWWCSPPRR